MRITARIQGSFPGDDGKKTILFILVFLVLDLAVSPWFGHPFDMDVWFKTGQWMLSGQNIYANPVHISYTPLWAYWTAAAFLAYRLSGENIFLWRTVVKLPLILGHTWLAYLAWNLLRESALPRARRAVILVLASIFIYVGAIWGQLETLVSASLLLTTMRITRGSNSQAGFLAGLAIALKQYALLPAIGLGLVSWRSSHSLRELVKYVSGLLGVPVIVTVGTVFLYHWDPRTIYFFGVMTSATIAAGPALGIWVYGGLSPWSLLHLVGIDVRDFPVFRYIWLPAELIVFVYALTRLRNTAKDTIRAVTVSISAFLASWPWVSEQVFSSVVPFAILQGMTGKRRLIWLIIVSQILVILFDTFDDGLLMFSPGLKLVLPRTTEAIQLFYSSSFVWVLWLRGMFAFGVWICALIILQESMTRKHGGE